MAQPFLGFLKQAIWSVLMRPARSSCTAGQLLENQQKDATRGSKRIAWCSECSMAFYISWWLNHLENAPIFFWWTHLKWTLAGMILDGKIRRKHLDQRPLMASYSRTFCAENDLVGGWPAPLKNMKVSWDDYSHILWKNKTCSKPPTRWLMWIVTSSAESSSLPSTKIMRVEMLVIEK